MFGTPIQIRIEDEAMIISNRSILPDGWTAETLMKPHDSIPYNPDIANVFYRAGYIEAWGRGIQKICDECRALGADLPRYEILGNGMRIHFKALKSALIEQPIVPKDQSDTLADTLGDTLDDTLASKVIALLIANPSFTMSEMAERTDVSIPSIKRTMKIL
jgi:ATP-dependent DNA helicase RecG